MPLSIRPLSRGLRHLAVLPLALLAFSASAAAPPFELNMERVKLSSFGGSLATASKTYFIPGVNLYVSASGSVWSVAKSGSANSQAHAKFFVKGLEKTFLQDLAKQVQDDLVAKLRAGGYTVLTYDDLKDHPLIAKHSRDQPNPKWGLPTKSIDPHVFVVAAPSDEQALDQPINGPVWWLKDVAKEKNLIVLVPEITFTVPQAFGEKDIGYKRAAASITLTPALKLKGAMVYTSDAKGNSATIMVQEHGMRLVTEVAGTTQKISENDTEFTSSWGRTSADYVFQLDRPAFSAGVLRATSQINALIVSEIGKAKPKK